MAGRIFFMGRSFRFYSHTEPRSRREMIYVFRRPNLLNQLDA